MSHALTLAERADARDRAIAAGVLSTSGWAAGNRSDEVVVADYDRHLFNAAKQLGLMLRDPRSVEWRPNESYVGGWIVTVTRRLVRGEERN